MGPSVEAVWGWERRGHQGSLSLLRGNSAAIVSCDVGMEGETGEAPRAHHYG